MTIPPLKFIAHLTALMALGCSLGGGAQSAEPPLALLEEQAFRAAADDVAPAVVQLHVIGGSERVGNVRLADGPATGTILTADGYVVTSLYRFNPSPATVIARLADGRQLAARRVATDFNRKLVLLKLEEASDLPSVKPAPYDNVRVGEWALTIGRAFRADRPYVTIGIISAKDRLHGRAVQTDAAVSAANYGGPLLDLQGRVVGILAPMAPNNESAIAGIEWYDSGIGFAIPLESWLPIAERLKEGSDLYRGMMGASFDTGHEKTTPPKLATCTKGGPAEQAGLKAGDLLESIDGQPVGSIYDVMRALLPRYAGDELEVVYNRKGESHDASITLVKPSELASRENDKAETQSGNEP